MYRLDRYTQIQWKNILSRFDKKKFLFNFVTAKIFHTIFFEFKLT